MGFAIVWEEAVMLLTQCSLDEAFDSGTCSADDLVTGGNVCEDLTFLAYVLLFFHHLVLLIPATS